MTQNPDELLRIGEAASLLGVTPETFRKWAKARKVAVFRTVGGHRRFRRGDVLALIRVQPAEVDEGAA